MKDFFTNPISTVALSAAGLYWGGASIICGTCAIEGSVRSVTHLTKALLENDPKQQSLYLTQAKKEAQAVSGLLIGTVCPFFIGTEIAYYQPKETSLQQHYYSAYGIKQTVYTTVDTLESIGCFAVKAVRHTIAFMSQSQQAIKDLIQTNNQDSQDSSASSPNSA